jgi:hypothetical protein
MENLWIEEPRPLLTLLKVKSSVPSLKEKVCNNMFIKIDQTQNIERVPQQDALQW